MKPGPPLGSQVIQDNITGRSKGYAFVEFAEFAAMDKAMDEVGYQAGSTHGRHTIGWLLGLGLAAGVSLGRAPVL